MDGQPLAHTPLRQRAKARAVPPQDSVLSFPFSLLEVVTIGRFPHNNGVPSRLAILQNINLAAQYADRIALLQQVRLSVCGTPDRVISAQNIEAALAMPVEVMPHPRMDCLLVIPLGG